MNRLRRAPQGDPAEPGFRQAVEAYAESLLPDILASHARAADRLGRPHVR